MRLNHPLPTIPLAATLLLAGCGQAPNAPRVAPLVSAATPAAVDVPEFSRVRIRYADGFLRLEAASDAPWTAARFDPARAGGWCFQLFINADQRDTGYGPGIDYLVRAIEVTPGGGVDVRRAEGGGGPGGWGESVGRVAMRVSEGTIECAIPLEMLGPDDGAVDFVLETYRTIPAPDRVAGGVRHQFVANYTGTSVTYRREGAVVRRGQVPIAPQASRVR